MTRRYGTESSILDSLRIRPTTAPDSSVLPVVLVHGSMDRQAAFARVIRSIPEATMATYDRRGYGSSAELPGPYDVDTHVDDLLNVMERVESDDRRVILVGHSFGGVVALSCAARHPERVAAVAVYESPMSWEPWWSSQSGGAQAVRTAHDPGLAAENFLKRFIGSQRWDELPDGVKVRRRREGRALVAELTDIRTRRPYDVDEIAVPVLSAVGSRAADHMRRGARLLAERASPWSLVVIEGAHHNAPVSHPAEFAERVIRPVIKAVADGRSRE